MKMKKILNFVGANSNKWEKETAIRNGAKFCACGNVATTSCHDGEGSIADACAHCARRQNVKDEKELNNIGYDR